MQWFSKIQQQAAEAAEMLISSEAAEKARQLAVQATQHATVLAQQATVKAQVRCSRAVIALGGIASTPAKPMLCKLQEVAKEAMDEAEKSISAFRQKASGVRPSAGTSLAKQC
jgi:hypothetical protein